MPHAEQMTTPKAGNEAPRVRKEKQAGRRRAPKTTDPAATTISLSSSDRVIVIIIIIITRSPPSLFLSHSQLAPPGNRKNLSSQIHATPRRQNTRRHAMRAAAPADQAPARPAQPSRCMSCPPAPRPARHVRPMIDDVRTLDLRSRPERFRCTNAVTCTVSVCKIHTENTTQQNNVTQRCSAGRICARARSPLPISALAAMARVVNQAGGGAGRQAAAVIIHDDRYRRAPVTRAATGKTI